MDNKTGGHAFPNITPDMMVDGGPGMTLRDYFAAKAMQAILAGKASDVELWRDETAAMTARQAYERADAMLAERSKQ